MISTTTHKIDGYRIKDYQGIVFGEVVAGTNFVVDIGASLRDFFGGRSKGYENELIKARDEAIREMEMRAQERGGNAVIGCKVDYEFFGQTNTILMVIASGTSVIVDKE